MDGFYRNCQNLTNLSLAQCYFKDYRQEITISKLKFIEGFYYLLRLDLSSSLSGDEDALEIANSTAFRKLQSLKLRNCKIGNEGCEALFKSQNLRSLKHLDLSKNLINQLTGPYKDLKEATDIQLVKYIMKLEVLDVRQNNINSLYLKGAQNFLKYTVVLAWNERTKTMKNNLKDLFPSMPLKSDSIQIKRPPLYVSIPNEDIEMLVQ